MKYECLSRSIRNYKFVLVLKYKNHLCYRRLKIFLTQNALALHTAEDIYYVHDNINLTQIRFTNIIAAQ